MVNEFHFTGACLAFGSLTFTEYLYENLNFEVSLLYLKEVWKYVWATQSGNMGKACKHAGDSRLSLN